MANTMKTTPISNSDSKSKWWMRREIILEIFPDPVAISLIPHCVY
jgi:hypothetical protein